MVLPSTNAKRVDVISKKETVVEIIDRLATESGEVWYCVWLNGKEVYILGRFIDLISEEAYW